jgi:hypothetical protein
MATQHGLPPAGPEPGWSLGVCQARAKTNLSKPANSFEQALGSLPTIQPPVLLRVARWASPAMRSPSRAQELLGDIDTAALTSEPSQLVAGRIARPRIGSSDTEAQALLATRLAHTVSPTQPRPALVACAKIAARSNDTSPPEVH